MKTRPEEKTVGFSGPDWEKRWGKERKIEKTGHANQAENVLSLGGGREIKGGREPSRGKEDKRGGSS